MAVAEGSTVPNVSVTQGAASPRRPPRGAARADGRCFTEVAPADTGSADELMFPNHLFAVRLLSRDVPITVVSALLGHSEINSTVKRYGRFASDAKVKWDAVPGLPPSDRGPTCAQASLDPTWLR